MRVPLPAARTMAAALRSGMMSYECLGLEAGSPAAENAITTALFQAIVQL
jgi:hypothetical protein